ncbi:unnamed protein product [Mytilus coruscus]|uniref:CCHC-type domain-containing protein n=1 Tax=Mytilus coruscus TaxID=42192 RepID=A0A6J8D427_MYTCO|nr:unnamed protein product [Mytilus coruscus]
MAQLKSAISGLQLSNENYDVAIDILKDRFGDIQNAVNAHYVELINLSCASNRTSELRFLFDKIEPAREAAESQSKEKTNDVKPQQPSNANVQSRYKPSYGKPQNVRSSGEALFSATDDRPFPPNRTKVKKLCIYCKGSHWSDECSMYKTVEDRKAQLNGLCYICLKSGHRLRDCTSDRKCVYCGKTKKHHRSLWLKKFATNRTEISNLADEAVETTESVSLPTESSFLSSGDIVLMQTAKTVITNMSDTCNEEIRLLLDSGSQRTYVSETLARKLKLKVESVEEVSVITFGSDKPKLVKTEKVTLQIKLADGTRMKLSANVVPKIQEVYLGDLFHLKGVKIMNICGITLVLLTPFRQKMRKTTIELLIDSCAVTAIDKSMPIKPPLEDFWNLETIGISEPSENSNDTKALEKFNNSVEYTNERYLVCWPWKSELETLNDNKELAPFLLAATIDLHLRKYNTPVATKIQDNIYVDNLLTGVNTNDELKELYTESINVFQEASMNLRDWCSNSVQFMSEIPKQDQANRERLKVLGITWTIKDDKLSMSGPKLESLELSSTKREILQSIASIFDPLGFFSPVTLLGKLLLQTLWSKKVEWDFKLSENDCELWKEIAFDIKQIQTHTFDRNIGLDGKCSYQLLCFCDASTKAYACAIYLRHETDESCRVDLIYSKTRLAQLRKSTYRD